MAGLVSILLAEGRSWKHMQLRCNLFFFLCTLLEYVCVCVCLLPYITHVPGGGVVVVSIVTLFQYNCSTVISAVFPHTHTHTCFSLWSHYEWTMNRDWGGCYCGASRCACFYHIQRYTHAHTNSHLAVFSLAYILSLSSPRPHVPLTHNALLPPRPESISHSWCQ